MSAAGSNLVLEECESLDIKSLLFMGRGLSARKTSSVSLSKKTPTNYYIFL